MDSVAPVKVRHHKEIFLTRYVIFKPNLNIQWCIWWVCIVYCAFAVINPPLGLEWGHLCSTDSCLTPSRSAVVLNISPGGQWSNPDISHYGCCCLHEEPALDHHFFLACPRPPSPNVWFCQPHSQQTTLFHCCEGSRSEVVLALVNRNDLWSDVSWP